MSSKTIRKQAMKAVLPKEIPFTVSGVGEYKLVDVELHQLTVEDHNRLGKLEVLELDRVAKPSRVETLRQKFESGVFRFVFWAIGVLPDGRKFRINGCQTGKLLEKYPEIIDSGIVQVLWLTIHCADEEALYRAWTTMDSRESARSAAEIIMAFLKANADCSGISNLNRPMASAIAQALEAEYIEANEGLTSLIPASKKDRQRRRLQTTILNGLKLPENQKFSAWFAQMFGTDGRFTFHAITYAVLRTYRVDPDAAALFWLEVASGSGESPTSGTRMLREWLLKTVKSWGSASSFSSHDTRAAIISHAAHCWNRWRQNLPVSRMAPVSTQLVKLI